MIRALLLTAALFLPAAGLAMDKVMEKIQAGPLAISGAHSLETPPTARSAAGYLIIENTGEADDILLDVSTETGVIHIIDAVILPPKS